MKIEANELINFHLTGERPKGGKNDPAKLELCPALLRGFRDLTGIRHDYPLVLVEDGPGRPVVSLSSMVNAVLQAIAPRGIAGERLRWNLINLEREIRALASEKNPGLLSEAWSRAAGGLLSNKGLSAEDRKALEDNLERARRALGRDGRIVGCDEDAAAAVLTHSWRIIREKRNRAAKKELAQILVKLSNIITNDYMRSNEARTAKALTAMVGTSFQGEFDFEAMSKTLPKTKAKDLLPKKRRERIERAISVLQSQKFFGSERGDGAHSFEAGSCTEALQAFRARLPEMVEFVKAIRVAGLEIENAYRAERHDRVFEQFDEDSLTPEDIAAFPSYLVCMDAKEYDDANKAALVEVLASQLPIKVLFQTSEVFESSAMKDGGGAFAGWNLGLARMAVGLGSAFVLQTTSANLHQMSEAISEGLVGQGPALFSVFSGSVEKGSTLPPYLVSASASQSRAFPTMIYNPQNGVDWASRFSIGANPQPERIWPVDEFSYQDEESQRVSEELAFTLVDHLAADRRFADAVMVVPRSAWDEKMIPVGEYLENGEAQNHGKVPYLLMVDGDDVLHRVVVSKAITDAARRSGRSWRSLQELGGIDNSHAQRLLDAEKRVWEEEKQREIEALRSQLGEGLAAEVAAEPPVTGAEAEAQPEETVEAVSPDVPYIETVRCSTCNECTNRNNKMFKYNENKQAYVADLEAGTYREMVEAAEVCKLAIIHPGKPWNPNEQNLEELMKRAEPFL